ncbi:MAG TPA: RdgB/HAM1 family non-canonical purine NTP pyrophosphatase [Candidatus Cloacimonadota bacterium]|nr:RdgB/HAM1 family non-canonical purine NTP pyrophosphatase [Candidatus Cloacimonadota bacterium]HPT70739.1 RdgB/HAM1 family non-canonical purine NTP pyrophosphatase [Candidatus Cloacimonadota bacterium]
MRLLIGSKNKHKIKEIKDILQGLDIELLSTHDFPDIPDVEEIHSTLEENAIKKATENAAYADCIALSDDTGLFIEALHGDPGVYAARYAGEHCSFEDNRKKVLKNMSGIANRKAFFKTVVALASPQGLIATTEGVVEGEIGLLDKGEGGFGYDPIFIVDGIGKTYSEMSDEEKNRLSHRGIALRKMIPILEEIIRKHDK